MKFIKIKTFALKNIFKKRNRETQTGKIIAKYIVNFIIF